MTDVCMDFAEHPEGSIATNIGRRIWSLDLLGETTDCVLAGREGKLALTMMAYEPEVRCRGPIVLSGSTATDEILRKMPAPSTRTTFGRRGIPGVRVLLPRTYISVNRVLGRKLVATVAAPMATSERASWYDIWAATVAISGICVKNGRAGSSASLGRKATDGKERAG
ncbi:MAG: hypothetical protein LQ345_005794 [Seirophora villosa]|nr:MAG: hypothetical protein LQ345_005794 [Seirophora villosa]